MVSSSEAMRNGAESGEPKNRRLLRYLKDAPLVIVGEGPTTSSPFGMDRRDGVCARAHSLSGLILGVRLS